MSFSSYANFRTAVSTWLDVSDLTTAVVDDLITVGEDRVKAEVRHRSMETSLNSTVASGVISVPSDYFALKYAYVDTAPTKILDRVTAEEVYRSYPTRSSSGKPVVIAREGANFIFGPYPDSAYTIKGIYYARLTALSSSLNTLFTLYPSLYLFAALSESEPILGRDPRIAVWESRYQNIRDKINLEDSQENVSMSSIAMRVA